VAVFTVPELQVVPVLQYTTSARPMNARARSSDRASRVLGESSASRAIGSADGAATIVEASKAVMREEKRGKSIVSVCLIELTIKVRFELSLIEDLDELMKKFIGIVTLLIEFRNI
jgi:hypothetical protein